MKRLLILLLIIPAVFAQQNIYWLSQEFDMLMNGTDKSLMVNGKRVCLDNGTFCGGTSFQLNITNGTSPIQITSSETLTVSAQSPLEFQTVGNSLTLVNTSAICTPTNGLCGTSTVPASSVTNGTFAGGNYTFPANVTMTTTPMDIHPFNASCVSFSVLGIEALRLCA